MLPSPLTKAGAAIGATLLLLTACSDPAPRLLDLGGECMGTTWSARVVAAEHRGPALAARIQAELDLVDDHLSTWKESSDLSRLARAAADEPVPVAPVTIAVLALAGELVEETGGAFDPTIGPLIDLWGFGAQEISDVPAPDDAAIEAARARLGWDAIDWVGGAGEGSVAMRSREDVELDVSAIAKGYAVDLAAEALRAAGVADFLLEVGGEMALSGRKPDGAAWRTGVVDPIPLKITDLDPPLSVAPQRPFGIVEVTDVAVATSGDYRNLRRLAGGRTVTHAIDPRTGRPVAHALASITVFAPTCARADALATAALVLGPEGGLALLERLEDVEAIGLVRSVDDDGSLDVRSTSGAPELRRLED